MSKSTKILFGILIVLGVIYVVQRLKSTTSTTENARPFSGLDTSKVKQFSISSAKEIAFARQESRWVIVSPIHSPADQRQVSILLSRIASDPSASVVADNLSDSLAYGLGPASPTLLFQQNDGRTVSFRLGGATPDFDGCYIQIGGETKVLSLTTNIRTLADQTLTDWRDKKIFSFGLGDVQSVDFALEDTLYHFFHRDTVWQVNGTGIPTTKADAIIESLVNTMAIDFIDTAISNEKSLLSYGISLSDGERITGRIAKLAEQTCISNSANNQTYVASPLLLDDLSQGLREIREDYLARKSS